MSKFLNIIKLFAGTLHSLLYRALKPNKTNLILVIPVITVLLPTLLAYPLPVPPVLVIPHIIYLAIFMVSILAYLRRRR